MIGHVFKERLTRNMRVLQCGGIRFVKLLPKRFMICRVRTVEK